MKYIFTDLYENFECVGGQCPDSCCKDWVIEIDSDTYHRYEQLDEPMKSLICTNIINEGDKYKIKLNDNGHCPFWNKDHLCDICLNVSPDYLSYTCENYPRRFVTCLETISVTTMLSCPEAARMIIQRDKPLQISIIDDGTKTNPESPNWLRYNIVVNGLTGNMSILQDSSVALKSRIMAVLDLNMYVDKVLGEKKNPTRAVEDIKRFVKNWKNEKKYFSNSFLNENVSGVWAFIYSIFDIVYNLPYDEDRKSFLGQYLKIPKNDEEEYKRLKARLRSLDPDIMDENILVNFLFGQYLQGYKEGTLLKFSIKAILYLATITMMRVIAIKEERYNTIDEQMLVVSKASKFFENSNVFDSFANSILETNSEDKLMQLICLL